MAALLAAPAAAQFGGLFGDPPPRPPSSVPGGRQSMPTPVQPQSQGTYNNPQSDYPPPSSPYGNGRGGIQSRPLPPPPGAAEPAPREPAVTALPQRQPRANAPPQPEEDVVAAPAQKIANKGALFSGLDKITGRIINFDVAIGETVQFGALQLTPRACYTRPATEASNTDAFVEVDEVTLQGEIKRIFTGWMFASSPGLHAVEHPIYDIWLTDCKGATNVAADKPPAAEPAAPPAARPQPPQRRTSAQPPRAPARQPPQQPPPGFPQVR
jgi:hypothetical protein